MRDTFWTNYSVAPSSLFLCWYNTILRTSALLYSLTPLFLNSLLETPAFLVLRILRLFPLTVIHTGPPCPFLTPQVHSVFLLPQLFSPPPSLHPSLILSPFPHFLSPPGSCPSLSFTLLCSKWIQSHNPPAGLLITPFFFFFKFHYLFIFFPNYFY